MTEKITQLIKENWNIFPISGQCTEAKEKILLSKFYHGRAWIGGKVLFFATYDGKPICLVKTARDISAGQKIKKEKESQEKFIEAGSLSAPRVYFDGEIDGKYLYAEEILSGRPLSKNLAIKKERELVNIISSRPFSGELLTSDVAKIFEDNFLFEDAEAKELIKQLKLYDLPLKRGFSHGDFTRKNIIYDGRIFRLIDWDRAGERPFWLIDAVHFMVSLRNIKNMKEWKRQAVSSLAEYAGINEDTAVALYCVETMLEIFCKNYPERYFKIMEQLSLL
ncbi:MAG: hypothetical protein PHC85_02115 [Candidatus Pacebacteria bacterium]|nr:hypothetical protein [Candidatus Paceibacterota bacterium]